MHANTLKSNSWGPYVQYMKQWAIALHCTLQQPSLHGNGLAFRCKQALITLSDGNVKGRAQGIWEGVVCRWMGQGDRCCGGVGCCCPSPPPPSPGSWTAPDDGVSVPTTLRKCVKDTEWGKREGTLLGSGWIHYSNPIQHRLVSPRTSSCQCTISTPMSCFQLLPGTNNDT